MLGAVVTQSLTQRLGLETTLSISILFACLAKACIAVADGPFLLALSFVIFGEILFRRVATVYIINSTSLRQACVPPALCGRVAAVVRVVSWGLVHMVLCWVAFLLVEWSDLRTTMIVGAVGSLVAFIWLVLSPIRRVQSL